VTLPEILQVMHIELKKGGNATPGLIAFPLSLGYRQISRAALKPKEKKQGRKTANRKKRVWPILGQFE
jgi:hypothetical protein